METRGMVVHHDRSTGDLTIWAATQAPHEWRLFCSRLLGIPEHRIRVIMRDTGGRFGQEAVVHREENVLPIGSVDTTGVEGDVRDLADNCVVEGLARVDAWLPQMNHVSPC
jgi:carbon-monoxide dehydrogenase large subunit